MIEINNLTTISVETDFLKKIAEVVLKKEGKEKNNLSIALVGPGRIRKINQKYLKKNRATDVLAFPAAKDFFTSRENQEMGEVVICLKEVKKNAKRLGVPFKEELRICLVHGILHLLGYDHEGSEKEARIMEEKEKSYSQAP